MFLEFTRTYSCIAWISFTTASLHSNYCNFKYLSDMLCYHLGFPWHNCIICKLILRTILCHLPIIKMTWYQDKVGSRNCMEAITRWSYRFFFKIIIEMKKEKGREKKDILTGIIKHEIAFRNLVSSQLWRLSKSSYN